MTRILALLQMVIIPDRCCAPLKFEFECSWVCRFPGVWMVCNEITHMQSILGVYLATHLQKTIFPIRPAKISLYKHLSSDHANSAEQRMTQVWTWKIQMCQEPSTNQTFELTGSKFNVNVKDQRFDALFTSSDFALDPTDPRYQSSEAVKEIQREAATRRIGRKPVQHKSDRPPADLRMQGMQASEGCTCIPLQCSYQLMCIIMIMACRSSWQ